MSIDYAVVNASIARIHLNRPAQKNPIGPGDARQILAHIKTAIAQSVRVVVFSGEGENFCSGADMKEYDILMHEIRDAKRSISDLADVLGVCLEINRALRKPELLSICAVKGWTVGLELSLASDFVVASEDTRFHFAETQIGVIMTSGMSKLLPQMVGLAQARRLMLLGEKISAQEAPMRNTLVETNHEYLPEPNLATEWSAGKDPSEWTFRLRDDVTFHNGKTFDSEDMKWTIAHQIGEESTSPAKPIVNQVKEMKTPDKTTITFILEGPNADFPALMGDYHLQVIPKDYNDNLGGEGTGPYIL